MSVVNQMLRDLDRRRGGEENVYGQHLQSVAGSGARKAIIAIGLLILGGLVVVIYLLLPRLQEVSPPVAVATPIQATVQIPVAPAPVASVAPVAVPAPPVVVPAPQIYTAVVPEPVAPPPQPVIQAAPAPVLKAAPPLVAAEAPAMAMEPRAPVRAPSGPTKIDVRPNVPPRTADSEFQRAVVLINQGRAEDARTALRDTLKLDAAHEGARQTLAVLLIEAGAGAEAEKVLSEGLQLKPAQSNFALLLARVKVERGDTAGGLEVLRQYGVPATNNAQYRAFAAALLQRLGRHSEAIEEYRAAVTLSPNTSVWWVGLGLSLESDGQTREAADAFTRARLSGSLSPEIGEFVERKLQTLR